MVIQLALIVIGLEERPATTWLHEIYDDCGLLALEALQRAQD